MGEITYSTGSTKITSGSDGVKLIYLPKQIRDALKDKKDISMIAYDPSLNTITIQLKNNE